MSNQRKDYLTAQKIEVALVFQQMLGTVEAELYLARNGVAPEVIARVLFQPIERRDYTIEHRAFQIQAA